MKFKYVIIDYNGTLTNDAIIGHEASNLLFKYYGVPEISLDQFRQTFKTPWIDFYVANGVDKDKIDTPTHQKLYRDAHKKLVMETSRLNEGVTDFLSFLKENDVKMGVLSGRNIDDLEHELVHFGIRNYFDSVIGEDHVNYDGAQAEKKTDQAIEELSILNFDEVLFVGDMVQDIENARRHNFRVAVITNGWQDEKRLRDAKPDYLVHSFNELQTIVSKNI